jgi:hypothetical protein
MRQFRVGEHAVGNQQPVVAFAASDAVMDNAGIVRANVSKLRAACYLADRLNAGCVVASRSFT